MWRFLGRRRPCECTTLDGRGMCTGRWVPAEPGASAPPGSRETPSVAQWLRACMPRMDPEAVDSIAAALRREHGVRGVMGLAKVPTGALLASGVPRWKVNALVAEIQKMRLGTRGALAPTLGAARALGARVFRVSATWSGVEVLQVRFDWLVVEAEEPRWPKVLRPSCARFPDDEFCGVVSEGCFELQEGDHVVSVRAEFDAIPSGRRYFNSTRAGAAHRLVRLRLRTRRGTCHAFGPSAGAGKICVADLSPPPDHAIVGLECATDPTGKSIGHVRPVFAPVAAVPSPLERGLEHLRPRLADRPRRSGRGRSSEAGRNPYTGAVLRGPADPFLADEPLTRLAPQTAVAVSGADDGGLPLAPVVAAAPPARAPPVAAVLAVHAPSQPWPAVPTHAPVLATAPTAVEVARARLLAPGYS